jgi:hypothetical protein
VAQAIQTRQVDNSDIFPREAVERELREAVRACSAQEAFTAAVRDVRAAVHQEIDAFLALSPFLSRLPSAQAVEIFRQIASRFSQGADRSRFGLMNATTSLARDTRDPELRWRLEELGGGIPVARVPTRSLDPADVLRVPESDAEADARVAHAAVGSGSAY